MLSLESLLPEHLGLIATAVDRITRLQEQNAAYLAHAAYLESLCARSPTNVGGPYARACGSTKSHRARGGVCMA